jgi:hypothetical protein
LKATDWGSFPWCALKNKIGEIIALPLESHSFVQQGGQSAGKNSLQLAQIGGIVNAVVPDLRRVFLVCVPTAVGGRLFQPE